MSIAKSGKWITFLALLATISKIASADEPTYQLMYRFQSGQFYHYDVDDRAEMTTQFGQNQSKLIQHTQILKSYRVIAVDANGGATIETTMEIVKMASQSGNDPVEIYDSEKPDEPPKKFEKIASNVGRPQARFQLTSNGRLIKVTMLATDVAKNVTESAAKADPSINPLMLLPEKPVKIGDKWTEKMETQVPVATGVNQPIQLIRSYELLKVENNIASIRVRTNILTPTTEPEILRNLVERQPSGTIEFDIQNGQLFNRSLKVDEKVVNAFGAQSLLQALGEISERLVDPSLKRVSTAPPKGQPK